MESTVVKFHCVAASTTTSATFVDHEFIIQPEFAFRRPGQKSTHLNMPVDICAKYSPCVVVRVNESGKNIEHLTAPLALMLKFTVSTTSTKASFFLYLTSARRQLVVPVA